MSMYWRDDLLPASLAGVPFHVDHASIYPGRRKAIQEFPGTDFVREQNLGPKARRFTISGYLIGRGYHLVRRRLEAVFDSVGPHLLVHPHHGRLRVFVDDDPEITESRDRGGYCSLSFKAIRAPDVSDLVVESDADRAAAAVSSARSASVAALGAQVTGLDDSKTLSAFRSRVSAVQSLLERSLGPVYMVTETASAARSTVTDLYATVDRTLGAPDAAMDAVASAVRAVVAAPLVVAELGEGAALGLTDGQKIDAVIAGAMQYVGSDDNGLAPLNQGALVESLTSTMSTGDRQTRNAQALTAIVRTEAAATLISSVLEVGVESTNQAQAVRGAVEALLIGASDGDPDGLLYAVDPDTFSALADLRAAVLRYLNSVALTLPTVESVTVSADTNVFMLAQQLFGDASRWTELVTQNGLADPLLVTAGTTLELLRG